ncbi:MAG: hypothetical protein ACFFDF_00070 [Candidatus Odinarchaeota archaeon]
MRIKKKRRNVKDYNRNTSELLTVNYYIDCLKELKEFFKNRTGG